MKNLALSRDEFNIVKTILKNVTNVIIFGSRVKKTNKPFSDLDVCIKGSISPADFELLQEAFENSDLPFKVDLVEYDKTSKMFQKIIDEQGIDLRMLD